MIPKKIYQTWFTKDLPYEVKCYLQQMLSLNPSYDHELYDDEDIFYFIKEHYGKDILSTYEKLAIGAAKSDFWRYLVLYKNGGIYLDLDSCITNDLNLLIKDEDKAIISRERNPDTFVQWCLMFEKNRPVLEKTIEKCIYNIDNRVSENILYLTGPQVYSDAIRDVTQDCGINLYQAPDDTILGCRFYGFDYENFCIFKHNQSHFLNLRKPDWREESKCRSVFTDTNN